MSEIDLEKAKIENLRWQILATLNAARPVGASETTIMTAVRGVIPDITALSIRRELDYLEHRKLITIFDQNTPAWRAELTRLNAIRESPDRRSGGKGPEVGGRKSEVGSQRSDVRGLLMSNQ
jgi:hypothetical protein